TVYVLPAGGMAMPGRERVAALSGAAGPVTTFALGVEPAPGTTATGGAPPGWEEARDLHLPIHAHADRPSAGPGAIAALHERGLLASDVPLLHCSAAGDADLEAIASSGAAVALAPVSDMAARAGVPPVQEVIDHRIRPGLCVDDERLTPGDM